MEENTKNGVNEPTRGGNKMKKKRRILAAVLRVSAGHGRLRHQRDENHPGRLHEH